MADAGNAVVPSGTENAATPAADGNPAQQVSDHMFKSYQNQIHLICTKKICR